MGKNKKVKETDQQKALAEIGKAQLDRYKGVFAPLEDKWIKSSRVTAGERERIAGEVGGGVEASFAPQRRGVSTAAEARTLSLAQARGGALAQTEGALGGEAMDKAALDNAVNLGRGEAVEAVAGLGDVASRSVSRSISRAFAGQASRAATADMVGSAAGVAAWGARQLKPADGNLSDFDAAGQEAVLAGASDGPGGYSVRGRKIYWNP